MDEPIDAAHPRLAVRTRLPLVGSCRRWFRCQTPGLLLCSPVVSVSVEVKGAAQRRWLGTAREQANLPNSLFEAGLNC